MVQLACPCWDFACTAVELGDLSSTLAPRLPGLMPAMHYNLGYALDCTIISLALALIRWFLPGVVAPALEAYLNSRDIYHCILTTGSWQIHWYRARCVSTQLPPQRHQVLLVLECRRVRASYVCPLYRASNWAMSENLD